MPKIPCAESGVSKMATKRMVYVGGLAEEVDEKTLHAALIPFGDITDVQIPLDYTTQKHRGFGFVEFELPEDAAAAIGNLSFLFKSAVKYIFVRRMCYVLYTFAFDMKAVNVSKFFVTVLSNNYFFMHLIE